MALGPYVPNHIITTGSVTWKAFWMCIEFFFLFTFLALAGAFIFLATPYYQKKAAAMGIKPKYFEGKGESNQKIRLGRAIISVLVFILMFFYLGFSLFQFHTVTILPDSTWELKNMFGIPLGTISPTEKRDIIIDGMRSTFTNTTYRQVDSSFVAVVTEKKTYISMDDTYSPIKALSKQLSAEAETKKMLSDTHLEPQYPFKFFSYTKYTLWGLIFIVGWWFWRKKPEQQVK